MGNRDTTAKLAKELWSPTALKLPPTEFRAKFDAIYASAEGIATLWQLGGAALDYLRSNPDALTVPSELAPTLLASSLVDARIVGLKLLNQCSPNLELISSSICGALESRHDGELYGGLCELSKLLDRARPPNALPVNELRPRLEQLRNSRDPYVSECAGRLADLLHEFRSN
jgi:hypothetical protein